jgi:drug/metabolite transporter (DMT)-like permease
VSDVAPPDIRTRRIGAYAVIYLVWGSTYLAMKFAVETLPPFALASARFCISGAILFAIARIAKGEALPTRSDWRRALIVGALLMIGGNASVMWAVQHVPSGVAALLVATTPIWLALLGRVRPTPRAIVGMVLGLVGVGVLVGPAAFAGTNRIDPLGVLVLVIASVSWAAGSLIQRAGTTTSPLMGTGAQMIAGGVMLLGVAAITGEFARLDLAAGTMKSWVSLAYLTVFGSLLGFTSYAWLMRNDSPARVATYSYVNPIIAVVLGALLANEDINARVIVAAAVIVVGVVAIVSEKRS